MPYTQPGFNLLPADTAAGIEQCLALRRQVFIEEQQVPPALEVDEHDQPGDPCQHWLLLLHNRPVGALRCLTKAAGVIKMQRFCLLAPYRGQGLGAAAVASIEQYYAARGAKQIILDAQCHAIPFYTACGYQVVSDIFLEAGIEHKKMQKLLPANPK